MTILVGFVCDDGIIIGADSEENRACLIKVSVPKIDVLTTPSATCIVAGAGDGDLSVLATEYIGDAIEKASNVSSIRAGITKAIKRIYAENIDNLPDSVPLQERPELRLLVAAWSESAHPILVKTARATTVLIKKHEAVGYGEHLANYVIATLYPRGGLASITMSNIRRLTVHVLHETKEYAPYCGGPSQIYELHNDGTVAKVSDVDLAAEELYNVATMAMSRWRLFYLDRAPEKTTQVEAELDKMKLSILKVRQLYQIGQPLLGRLQTIIETGLSTDSDVIGPSSDDGEH